MTSTIPHALTMPDGTVQIMYLVDGADLQEAIDKHCAINKKGIPINPRPVSVRQVTHADIPQDRTFRNAWRDTGTTIKHDMDHAREIHMARVRRVRDRTIEKLDVPFMQAIEKGDAGKCAAISVEKQSLRDIPATLDLTKAVTPEALAVLWPEGLPRV